MGFANARSNHSARSSFESGAKIIQSTSTAHVRTVIRP